MRGSDQENDGFFCPARVEALRPPSALCPRPLAGLIDSAELTDRQWYRNRKPAVALKACPLDCSAQSLVNPLACWIDTIWWRLSPLFHLPD